MITADISVALKKTQMMLNLSRAAKANLTDFSKDAVLALKRSAANMKKTPHKTGQLARSIGFLLAAAGAGWKSTIGTGLGNVQDVKYARILDQGGIILPRRRKYLTVPLGKTQGVAANFPDAFFMKTKAGKCLLARETGKGRIEALFLLVKQVQMPAFGWFTSVWEWKLQFLNQNYMNEQALLRTAERLAGGGSGD